MPDDISGDPYTGLHADSIYAVWHDPSTYDHMTMGPPYLPEAPVKLSRAAQEALKEHVRKVANASPVEQMFLTLLGDYQHIVLAELGVLVAVLRAAAHVHQSNHWQTRGQPFFSDHLLYERLYNESLGLIDRLAERAVGLGNRVLVHPVIQASEVGSLVKFFCGDIQIDPTPDALADVGFVTEAHVLAFIGLVYNSVKASGVLTNGLDNLLQDIADQHESFAYLLRQRCQTKVSYERHL